MKSLKKNLGVFLRSHIRLGLKAVLFLVLISGFGMTLTEKLMAADYVPVLVFGSKSSIGNGQFDKPQGIAVDGSGNIFVADNQNHRIQKFNSAGVYQSQFGSNGTGNGEFLGTYGVAVDSSGNIFVADQFNHRVQKFDSAGMYQSQFGSNGTGNGQFKFPYGVAIDSSGNIFVADSSNHRIQKFDSSGVYQSQFGSNGTGNGQFNSPYGVAVDRSGNIFVADAGNQRIQRFNNAGIYQSQFGSLGSDFGQFINPCGVAVDSSGNIFVADTGNNRIQKFNSAGVYQRRFGSRGTSNGQFYGPNGVAIDSSGNIFVADTGNNRIQKLDIAGNYQIQFGSYVVGNGQFNSPSGMVIDSSGNIFVADTDNNRIQKFNSLGVYQSQFGIFGSDYGCHYPFGIAIDSSDDIYVTDNCSILKFDRAGVYQNHFGSDESGNGNGQFNPPKGIAIDSSGNIFVADFNNDRIQKLDSAGVYQSQFGSQGKGNGQFMNPYGIAIDSSGNIFVADFNNYRIQKFDSAGFYQSQFGRVGSGNGQFIYPSGVAVDSSGNIFVADMWNHRIQKFDSTGVYQSQFGSYGTGNGQFRYPQGIVIDNSDNIFVADSSNNRIQKWAAVVPNPIISGYIRDSSNNPVIGVILTFSSDSGTSITDSSGFYSKTFGSDWSGTVTPSKGGYMFTPPIRSYSNVTSNMTDQNYDFVAADKAIIISGGGNYSTNALWNATKLNADYAYDALLFKGYLPEKIYYLSADSNFTSPVKGFASKQNLQDAIQSWAMDADNLLIYMVDHGGNGTFKINESEILEASELDRWLDNLQQTIPGNITLIYDACESGSFIKNLMPPTGKKRIIVTSASADEPAVFASEGTFSFSWNFWSQIYGGSSFYQAFLNSQNTMELSRSQHSLIDADGNGVPGEKADSAIAATIRIGDGIATGADFPLIGSVSPPQTLTDKTSALIYAENVIDADGIKKVWAAITPPKNIICYSAGIPITSLPTTELIPVGSNRYEATYTGFTAKGTYKIAIFATDTKDFTSIPDLQKHITYVTQTQDYSPPVKKGDISGDNQVNLADVISALQILSGLNPSQIRCDYGTSGADVNGDNRVGLHEVIYILQVLSGLR